jgi:hypothetical protein
MFSFRRRPCVSRKSARSPRGQRRDGRRFRPRFDILEDRVVPTTFQVGLGDVAGLIQAINTANGNGQPGNTIELTAGSTYSLTAADNYWYGPNGLPAISSNLTIEGNGAILTRGSTAPFFRFFHVSGGLSGLPAGSLTLHNLTVGGGTVQGGSGGNGGGGGAGMGGAIFNQGTLTLNAVTLSENDALGGPGGPGGAGGGGGGGLGGNAAANGGGGGFGGPFPGGTGGAGAIGQLGNAGGGGGGFRPADAGLVSGGAAIGGQGGGLGALGGQGGYAGPPYPVRNDGGGGGSIPEQGTSPTSGAGGHFGAGGQPGDPNGGGGGGGGVGGGGGGPFFSSTSGSAVGSGGGGGFGGGGGGGHSGTISGSAGHWVGAGGFGGFGGGGGAGSPAGGGGFGGGTGGPLNGAGVGPGGGGAGLGGAVFNFLGTVTITNSTLDANMAEGGLAFAGGAGNGGAYGGALFNLNGSVTLVNDTFATNALSSTGPGSPGAIRGSDVYNLAYGNSVTDGSPVTATLTVFNCILDSGASANLGSSPPLVNDQENGAGTNTATVNATGPNILIKPAANMAGTITGTPSTVADPMLGGLYPLTNGGPTETYELLPGSPALNAGAVSGAPATDQRGVPRGGTVNLGSYQATASQLTLAGFPSTVTAGGGGTVTVTALDSFGKQAYGYPGTVTIAITGAGTVAPAAKLTSGSGPFAVTLTTAGGQTLTATDGTMSMSQPVQVNPGSPAVVTPVGGTPQSATVGTAFGTQLQVRVTDGFNNPLSGVTVTFAAPTGGAGGTFAGSTTVTTVNGVATAPAFTANGTAGSYQVTATVAGVGTAALSLTNLAPSGGGGSGGGTMPPPARPITARLVSVKVGKRKRQLVIDVFFADTGAKKEEFPSPFQKPAYRNIQVAVGASDQIILTARKGKRTVTETLPG